MRDFILGISYQTLPVVVPSGPLGAEITTTPDGCRSVACGRNLWPGCADGCGLAYQGNDEDKNQQELFHISLPVNKALRSSFVMYELESFSIPICLKLIFLYNQ